MELVTHAKMNLLFIYSGDGRALIIATLPFVLSVMTLSEESLST